jgi:type II secretion system protein N
MKESDAPEHWARRWASGVGALLYLGSALAVLVLLRLPVDRILAAAFRAVEQRGGPRIDSDAARLRWNGRLHISRATVGVRIQDKPVPVELESLELVPEWTSLILGSPAARVRGEAYGGRMAVRAQAGSRALQRLQRVEAELRSVSLDAVEVLAALTGGRIRGTVDAALDVRLDGVEPATWSGGARLSAVGLDLQNSNLGGLTLERLPLGRAEVELELAPGSGEVRLRRGEISGPEVELMAAGRVILDAELGRSRLDLSARVRLSGRTRANLGEALGLLGYTPDEQGWIEVSLGGTLQSPRTARGGSGVPTER